MTNAERSQRYDCQLVELQRPSALYVRHARSEEAEVVALNPLAINLITVVLEYGANDPVAVHRLLVGILTDERIWRQEEL